jgi:hypothetical protein
VCTVCWWGSLRERDYWGDQDLGGSYIRLDLQEVGVGLANLITLVQNRDRWRELATREFRFKKCWEFLE